MDRIVDANNRSEKINRLEACRLAARPARGLPAGCVSDVAEQLWSDFGGYARSTGFLPLYRDIREALEADTASRSTPAAQACAKGGSYDEQTRLTAVWLVLRHGGVLGDKAIDRILHEHRHAFAEGRAPRARTVRRWVERYKAGRQPSARPYRRHTGADATCPGERPLEWLAPGRGQELPRHRGGHHWDRPDRRRRVDPIFAAVLRVGAVVDVDGRPSRYLGRTATGRYAFVDATIVPGRRPAFRTMSEPGVTDGKPRAT